MVYMAKVDDAKTTDVTGDKCESEETSAFS